MCYQDSGWPERQLIETDIVTSNNVTRILVSPTGTHVGVFNGSGFCTYEPTYAREYEEIFPVAEICIRTNLSLDHSVGKV